MMGLGKGLDSLIPSDKNIAKNKSESKDLGLNQLPISKIENTKGQPRKNFDEESLRELSESIKEHGVIQPITVRKLPTGYYQIIAGERRWRAAKMAGLKELPVNIIECDDQEAKELALIENLQREDLDDMEVAFGFRTLMNEYGLTQEQVAERMSVSRSAVANTLRLITLPPEIQDMVRSGQLSAGHARAVLKVSSESLRVPFAKIIIEKQLSVRQAENMASRMTATPEATSKAATAVRNSPDYLSDVEKALSGAIGHRVSIVSGKKKGKIEIEYYGGDDLQVLIDALTKLKI